MIYSTENHNLQEVIDLANEFIKEGVFFEANVDVEKIKKILNYQDSLIVLLKMNLKLQHY